MKHVISVSDFLVALLWLTRDQEGRIPLSDVVVHDFVKTESQVGWEEATGRIKLLFHGLYLGTGRKGSASFYRVLHRLQKDGYFEIQECQDWRRMIKGSELLAIFTPNERAYLEQMAKKFRSEYPIAA